MRGLLIALCLGAAGTATATADLVIETDPGDYLYLNELIGLPTLYDIMLPGLSVTNTFEVQAVLEAVELALEVDGGRRLVRILGHEDADGPFTLGKDQTRRMRPQMLGAQFKAESLRATTDATCKQSLPSTSSSSTTRAPF